MAETIACTNCRKHILASNILPHEAYCARNVSLCTKCDTPYTTTDREAHEREEHMLKYCTFCKQLYEAYTLDAHMRVCELRTVPTCIIKEENKEEECGYCGIPVEEKNFAVHVKQCEAAFEQQETQTDPKIEEDSKEEQLLTKTVSKRAKKIEKRQKSPEQPVMREKSKRAARRKQ